MTIYLCFLISDVAELFVFPFSSMVDHSRIGFVIFLFPSMADQSFIAFL
jgi:hypothetical protein